MESDHSTRKNHMMLVRERERERMKSNTETEKVRVTYIQLSK